MQGIERENWIVYEDRKERVDEDVNWLLGTWYYQTEYERTKYHGGIGVEVRSKVGDVKYTCRHIGHEPCVYNFDE